MMKTIVDYSKRGDLNEVKRLMNNASQKELNESLVEACFLDHRSVVAALLQSPQADVDCRCAQSGNSTPLIIAAERGYVELAHLLLDSGADINARAFTERGALALAVANSQADVVRLLIDRGIDVNQQHSDGNTAAIDAISFSFDDPEMLQLLLESGKVDLDLRNNRGNLLHEAVLSGNITYVQMVLDHGANIDATTCTQNETPLMLAVGLGSEEIVNLLIDQNADMSIQFELIRLVDVGSQTMRRRRIPVGTVVVYWAQYSHDEEIFLALVRGGADVNELNEWFKGKEQTEAMEIFRKWKQEQNNSIYAFLVCWHRARRKGDEGANSCPLSSLPKLPALMIAQGMYWNKRKVTT